MTLQERCEIASIEQLKACAIALFTNDDDAAGIALDATLTELELRMSENEFVAFCDILEAA